MTSTTQHTAGQSRSPQRLHDDIQQTRAAMDETLNELGNRLHPRHLLDEVIDLFDFSDDSDAPRSEQFKSTCRTVGRSAAKVMREHPMPVLLCGAGVMWWLYDEYGGDSEEDEGLTPSTGEWRQDSLAWQEGYQWEGEEAQRNWKQRAEQTLAELKERVNDNAYSAQEKLKLAAGKLMSLSGHKRREVHARWANLREHSGSFVDARTGEPYTSSYGNEWENLVACDAISSGECWDLDEAPASEQAESTLAKLQDALSNMSGSVTEAAGRCAGVIGEYGRSLGVTAKQGGESAAHMGSRWGRSAGKGVSKAGRVTAERARSMSRSAQRQFSDGYHRTRHSLAEAIEDYPLAVGAACFGLGLLGGLLIPRSRYEDEVMGEASDEVKSKTQAAGEQVYRRAKHVASETASAAMDEAERQGLTPEKFTEQTSEAIARTREKAKSSGPAVESAAADVRERVESVVHEAAETARRTAKEESGTRHRM